MKKFFYPFLMVTLLIFLTCSCSSGKDTSLDDVLDSKKIVIGIDSNDATRPTWGGNESFSGFSVECAKICAKRLGISAEFVAVKPDDLGKALDDKDIDCYWNYSAPTRQLKAEYLFIESHATHHQTVMVPSKSKISSLADLAGKTVGVVANSYSQEALENAGVLYSDLGKVETYENLAQLFTALKNSAVDAAVVDDNEARNHMMSMDEVPFSFLTSYISTEKYHIAFRRTDLSLQGRIESILSDMVADGTMAQISQKWFGYDITKE